MVYLNGEWIGSDSEAVVSVNDRGLVFADAIYEVIHVYNGKYFELDAHLARMQNGFSVFSIPFDALSLRPVLLELLEKSGVRGEASVYVQVTRGAAPRSHGLPQSLQPTVFAYAKPIQPDRSHYQTGISAVFCEDLRWQMCQVKTTGLLFNCLAKEEASKRGAQDAVFHRGETVTEGTAANLFAVIGGELRTHPDGNWVLPGITKNVLIRLAKQAGIPVVEAPFTKRELLEAEEAFFTGTITEINPLLQLESQKIGSGKPGKITVRLQELFLREVGLSNN